MEITYVYYTEYPAEAAHGKQIIHTCNALVEHGHDVTVISAGDIDTYAIENGIAIDFGVVHPLIRVPADRPDRVVFYLTALNVARSADVIYSRDIRFLKFLSLFPGFTNRFPPIAFEAHKAFHKLEAMSADDERRYLSVADAVVTISRGIKEDIEAIGVTVSDVIPDAANLDLVPSESKTELRKRLGLDRETTIFVYAGSFKLWKNDLRLVIDGLAEIHKHQNVFLLMIGGDDTTITELKSHAKSVGLPENAIQFTGRIPHTAVFPYLKASDVGIVPLTATNEQSSKYTSPLKLYEYLACGLCVIASDVPAMSTVATDDENIVLYSEGQVSSFVECGRSQLVRACRQNPDQYSYLTRSEKICNVLKQISEE